MTDGYFNDIFELGELFERVQMEPVFQDSKTFVDCIPLDPLPVIHNRYESEKSKPGFSLREFISKHFKVPRPATSGFESNKNADIREHISTLWDVLTKETKETGSSLIALPKPFVVPGGRFRELFYWDSYFTMLGLQIDGRYDLIENMIDNFAWLIDQYGYVPNGNRTYFLGRSQPPFLSLMTDLLAKKKGNAVYEKYLPQLRKEHAFWMRDEDAPDATDNRVARLADGVTLNHYWDAFDTPRPEAYRKDQLWVQNIRETASFFRHERAACESGWDFSTRWMADEATILSMKTADLVPVDLNCLLWYLETSISTAAQDETIAQQFCERAERRKKAIEKYCWNETSGFYFDYDFHTHRQSRALTIAAAFPLFFKLASEQQAGRVAHRLEQDFLKEGGFVTTLKSSGQQWDAPNGWAPLQWITIKGLANYGYNGLAKRAACRWMRSNEIIFEKTGKMMEKYNVETKDTSAMPGTYPTQDGFGWTNGVYLALDRFVQQLKTGGG